jgi:hypothetical protein
MAALGIDVDILVATSVGSLNACALAATAHFPGVPGAHLRAALLRRHWEEIDANKVFSTRFLSALFSLPLHLTNIQGPHFAQLVGGAKPWRQRLRGAFERHPYNFKALYDTAPLQHHLRNGAIIDWARLQENLQQERPYALALLRSSCASRSSPALALR